jgi:hypothetical protein
MCRVGLSLRGIGSGSPLEGLPHRGHAFSLPLTDFPCQTSPMNRLLIPPVLPLTLLLGNPASSADFQKGLTANDSEDYATDLREWTPLAEQGDALAQFSLGVMYRNGQGVPQDDKTTVKMIIFYING